MLASTLRQLVIQGGAPGQILSLAHAKAASGSLPLWLSWSLCQVMDGVTSHTCPAAQQHRQLSSDSSRQGQGLPSGPAPASSPSSSTPSTPSLQPSPLMRSIREMQAQQAQHKQHRAWVWYDADNEALEQRGERKRAYPDAGYANLQNVPQSMKKMNRVLELVRGLHYDEAVAQCQIRPHKAGAYLLQVLEHAKKDALEKGVSGNLVVDECYATKASYLKKVGYKAKGRATLIISRRSHVKVILRPLPSAVPYRGFTAHKAPLFAQKQWAPRATASQLSSPRERL
ncbi:ribosomal protein L22/L17 [Dunaliella salina]|uniref:Ribosomal protein L22/L17 n=1 Tax=Dunaliella salina TaxID=3046 RepID=A0ABQ7GEG2_DUNSA|nr:ribosomal protein L22/L17 [Dunaliella salina]|eukprot:KAF5832959.1 ribosomal protein L22/L17 [Dunaliella salina]